MSYDKAISYSGLSLYRKCPKKWHRAYILGVRDPSGPAAERGTRMHSDLERFFLGAPYPSGDKALAVWQDYMTALKSFAPSAERELGMRSDWTPCGFEDDDAHVRGKTDLDFEHDGILHLHDWKSGRIYDDHVLQGEFYVALSPDYDDYTVRFVYLDQPLVVKEWKYTLADRDNIREALDEEISVLRADEEWKGIPGDHCHYCPLSWRQGGDCKRAR